MPLAPPSAPPLADLDAHPRRAAVRCVPAETAAESLPEVLAVIDFDSEGRLPPTPAGGIR